MFLREGETRTEELQHKNPEDSFLGCMALQKSVRTALLENESSTVSTQVSVAFHPGGDRSTVLCRSVSEAQLQHHVALAPRDSPRQTPRADLDASRQRDVIAHKLHHTRF